MRHEQLDATSLDDMPGNGRATIKQWADPKYWQRREVSLRKRAERAAADIALDFLSKLRPQGPWVLTAIQPDGLAETITARTKDDVRDFITAFNGIRNLYYSVNPTTRRMTKKASKADIAEAQFIHADLDPREGETADQAKERYLKTLATFEPQPTAIVESGNGLNCLWRLQSPVSPEHFTDVEARNLGLILSLGGDRGTHNIDRILRLPGTINLPNAKKRKAGREDSRSRVVEFNKRAYRRDAFHGAEEGDRGVSVQPTVDKSDASLPPDLMKMIREGVAPGDRSDQFFRAVSWLKRLNWDVGSIVDLLSRHPNGIAAKYRSRLRREIERAYDKAADPSPQIAKTYEMVRAEDVVIRPLDWLWKGHLLRGSQELITGTPGLGKSQVQCSLVAGVTTGRDWPDGTRGSAPGNVIMVTAEDCLDQIVVPRLIAAGADLNRIRFLKAIRQDDKRRMFLLGEDHEVLEQMIRDVGDVALVTIDPITAYMGKINSGSATDVRAQLGPLNDLAERINVAISTLTHPPKEGSQRAIDHFIGSQAFIANGRIGHLCVGEMRTGADGKLMPTGRILFTNPKHNYTPEMPTLAYQIDETIVGERPTQTQTTFVEWHEPVDFTADQAVAATKTKRTTPVDDFLRELLADGQMWKADIEAEAKNKFTTAQLTGAKGRLGIKTEKIGLEGWKWKLP